MRPGAGIRIRPESELLQVIKGIAIVVGPRRSACSRGGDAPLLPAVEIAVIFGTLPQPTHDKMFNEILTKMFYRNS